MNSKMNKTRWLLLALTIAITPALYGRVEYILAPGGYLIEVTSEPADNEAIAYDDATGKFIPQSVGGVGTLSGTSTDNNVARFNGTDGTSIQNSVVTIGDTGATDGQTTADFDGEVSAPNFLDETASASADAINITSQATGDLLSYNAGWKRTAIGTGNQFLSANGGVPTWTSLSGDGTLSAGVLSVSDLTIAGETANDLLYYTGSAWDDAAVSGDASFNAGAFTVSDLTISGETAQDILYYDGANWNDAAITGDITFNAGATTVTDLTISGEVQGNILYFNGTNWVRLAVGSAGQVLHTNGAAANPTWDTDDTGTGTSITTKGDLQGFSTVNARVPVGTDGQVLIADSADAEGVSYASSGGDVSGVYTNLQLGTGVVGTNEIATDGVEAAEIAASAVGTSEINDNTVAVGDIGTNAVAADELADNAVDAGAMADNAVGTAEITDGTVANADLVNITTDSLIGRGSAATGVPEVIVPSTTYFTMTTGVLTLTSGGIDATAMGTASVADDEIATDGVGAPEIETDGVGAAEIAANSVAISEMADDAVGLAELAAGTAGNLITYDPSGNPAAVATGTATHVLTSNGAGAAPTFQAPAGATEATATEMDGSWSSGAHTFPTGSTQMVTPRRVNDHAGVAKAWVACFGDSTGGSTYGCTVSDSSGSVAVTLSTAFVDTGGSSFDYAVVSTGNAGAVTITSLSAFSIVDGGSGAFFSAVAYGDQ